MDALHNLLGINLVRTLTLPKKSETERIAVCETEIVNLKSAVNRVCLSDIPNIYTKLEALSNFSTETRSFFKLAAANSETLKEVNSLLFSLKTDVSLLRNQESLGKKEKASIILAAVAGVTSIIVTFLSRG